MAVEAQPRGGARAVTRLRLAALAVVASVLLMSTPSALAADARADRIGELVALAFPEGAPFKASGKGSRGAFLEVLASPAFLHAEVGPFDLHLLLADGFADAKTAQVELDAVAKGLLPTAAVMERYFSRSDGLIGGRRLPIVLTHSKRDAGQHGFDQVVALLEWAEDDYSGWKRSGNLVFDPALLAGLNVRTWEVQVFNLAHELASAQGKAFAEHGLGYYQLAHVAARVLNQGAWGMVPPWLAQGIIDELDIEAYGEAWVGGDWWERQTPGWFRPGWSGFVPQGQRPPAPITGPPANLGVIVRETGDSWQQRSASKTRHWENLVLDQKSEAPASFLFMADNESFLPRDRAMARAALHLMLQVAPPQGRDGLLALLDRVPSTPPSGMFDSDPITVAFNKALGGVSAVDELESLALGDMLEAIGQQSIKEQLTTLGASEMLRIPDHREQAEWLYHQPFDSNARQAIWTLILEAEYHQQLAEWKHLSQALDQGLSQALKSAKHYPTKERDQDKLAQAFWKGLQG